MHKYCDVLEFDAFACQRDDENYTHTQEKKKQLLQLVSSNTGCISCKFKHILNDNHILEILFESVVSYQLLANPMIFISLHDAIYILL